MRLTFLVFLFLSGLVPANVFAACIGDGATIIFVNGILTSKKEAKQETKNLQDLFTQSLGGSPLVIENGYNPSHFAGVGDLLESISQAFGRPVSDYDLNTILMQIHPEVTTRKILLVGHSQGTFYTNELYDYLTTHGVPRESIAVYNIATPASYVAGGGGYVTSSNDKLINSIRDTEVEGNREVYVDSHHTHGDVVASALRSNITIPKEPEWESDGYGGHHFQIYLDGAASRIVSDARRELGGLSAKPSENDPVEGCFTPPSAGLLYDAQRAGFAAGDALAKAVSVADKGAGRAVLALADGATRVLAKREPEPIGLASATALGQGSAAALALGAPKPEGRPVAEAPSPNPPPHSPPPSPPPAPLPPPSLQPPAEVADSGRVPDAPSAPAPSPASPAPAHVFGGGAPPPPAKASAPPPPSTPSIALDVVAPVAGFVFATSTVAFSGTSDPAALVALSFAAASASTTADSSGNWLLSVSLPEGTTTVQVSASNAAVSTSTSREVEVDLTPPDPPTLTVAACALSLFSGGCLVPVAETNVAWNDAAGASYYALAKDGVVGATSTATSTLSALDSDATTTLSVVAYDKAGNAATSSPALVASVTRPLIINEVAWGGDTKNALNQWVEVKNLSPYTIDLSHLSVARSGGVAIPLSGSIPATSQNYAVIEPAPLSTISTGLHTVVVPFDPLSTSTAEELKLAWNGTTLDSTPASSACTGWCAGKAQAILGSNLQGLGLLASPLSMERISDSSDGTLSSSWRDTDSYGPWIASSGGFLWGTPGAANSKGYPEAGVACPGALLTDVAAPGPSVNPGTGCTYLSRFITGDSFGADREGALYRGDVGSSTLVMSHSFSKALATETTDGVPPGASAGEHFFFAIWELRVGPALHDNTDFNNYFTASASTTSFTPPHGNYVVIPWIYAP